MTNILIHLTSFTFLPERFSTEMICFPEATRSRFRIVLLICNQSDLCDEPQVLSAEPKLRCQTGELEYERAEA